LLAFPLSKNEQRHISAVYRCSGSELRCGVSGNYSKKGLFSTVHFGGGTPLMLGISNLDRIVNALKHNFCVSSKTELAFETTSSMLTEENLASFNQLGFYKNPYWCTKFAGDVRKKIGRRESPKTVLEKNPMCSSFRMDCSTDVIIGLPPVTEIPEY
jgi:oxygen-independent coproporphyrinogen-3 oxidase